MNEIEIIISINIVIVIIILIFKWQDVISKFFPEWFYKVKINKKDGDIVIFNYYIGNNKKNILYGGLIYEIEPSNQLCNRLKFFEYDEGDPFPKKSDDKLTLNNLELELKRKQVEYWKLFQEPKNILEKLMEMAMPFLLGLVIGALGMYLQYKDYVPPSVGKP